MRNSLIYTTNSEQFMDWHSFSHCTVQITVYRRKMSSSVFWDMSCSPLYVNRCLRALLATWFMLVSCMVYSATLKMEATSSSETSVDFQWTTRRYIPENRTLHNHHCGILKSSINILLANLNMFIYTIKIGTNI
jgi:hypothetical protein